MGNLCRQELPPEEREKFAKSKQIDAQMRSDFRQEQDCVKLLLLGAGESGKSTIFKQLQIIYGTGFSSHEKQLFQAKIYENVMSAIQALCQAVRDLGLVSLTDADTMQVMERVLGYSIDDASLGDNPELVGDIQRLWSDPAIQQAWQRRSEFQIIESHRVFLDDLGRISSPDYTPTDADIVATRVRTTGVHQKNYTIEGVPFAVIDVGGQKSERKKWIWQFENVSAVMFVAALSEYNQNLYEDDSVNRMADSIDLFGKIINETAFAKTHMMLFLNKRDLFKVKLEDEQQSISAVPHFQDKFAASGRKDCDYEQGHKFFEGLFLGKNQNPEKMIFTHVTCATDKSNVDFIFNASKAIILRGVLGESGFST